MSTGLQYLDVGIVVTVFAGIFGWMIYLTTRRGSPRVKAPAPAAVRAARQPWDDDKPGRRGNR